MIFCDIIFVGYFKIKSKWNNKYLGVDSKDNMVLHDEDDILWKWVGSTLVNKKNQQFLDISGADTSNGKIKPFKLSIQG